MKTKKKTTKKVKTPKKLSVQEMLENLTRDYNTDMENKKLYIANIETKNIKSITLSMLIDRLNMDGFDTVSLRSAMGLSDLEYIYLNYQDAVACIERELVEELK